MMRVIALFVLLGLAQGAPQVAAPLAAKKPSGHVQLSAQQQRTMHSGCVNACRPSPVESKCVTACEAKMYKCIDETGPNETPEDTEKCQSGVISHFTKTKGIEKKEEKKEEKKGEAKKEEKKAEKKAKMFLQLVRDDDEVDEEASDDVEDTATAEDESGEDSAAEDESVEDTATEEEAEESADGADEAGAADEVAEEDTTEGQEEQEEVDEDSAETSEADEDSVEASEEDTSADDSDDADAVESDTEEDSSSEDESLMQTSSKDDDDADTTDGEESEDESEGEESEEDSEEGSTAAMLGQDEEEAGEEGEAEEAAEEADEETSDEEEASDDSEQEEQEEDESFVQVKSSWKPEPCGELKPGVPCVKLYEHPQGSTVVMPCPVGSLTDPGACNAYFGDKADDAKCPQITCPKALGVTMKLTCGGGCCPTCWAPDHVIAVDRHTTVDDARVVDPAPQAPSTCGGVKCFKLACAPGFSEGHVNGNCCYSCVPGR